LNRLFCEKLQSQQEERKEAKKAFERLKAEKGTFFRTGGFY
jgi:hypothetical protein